MARECQFENTMIDNTPNLWASNHPRDFWLCEPDLTEEVWQEAILQAFPILNLETQCTNINAILELTLGEGQFGINRYSFGFSRRLYYKLKPFLNQKITHLLRRIHSGMARKASGLGWPIEMRYVRFQREIIRQGMLVTGKSRMNFRYFWPQSKRFAFVLTHDVETAEGQRAIPALADLEEGLGFRSLFNFVPERYPLDQGLMDSLRKRGFEIGVHGLRHDSSLFSSRSVFVRQAAAINRYIEEFQADGFRSPYTHRNPDWMQLLEAKYDLSFFDTDPFEPMPGGVMNIWPFAIGKFIELPYTLPQDSTLVNVLGRDATCIWLEKLAFIKKFNGMALMIVHPDYSGKGLAWQYYADFLKEILAEGEYWHALPREVASWWRIRSTRGEARHHSLPMAQATLADGDINIEIPFESIKDQSSQEPATSAC